MIEIKGTYNTALCYTENLEKAAYAQIAAVCNEEAFSSSVIRIMPDVHSGKGCTIGTTMTITDKVVPFMVGVDIGCGMYTVSLGNIDIDFEKLDNAAHFIPCGREVWDSRVERFDLTELRCYRSLKESRRLERSIGTLGGGNHFIEIDTDDDGNKYLIIHSGSRNLGTQTAEIYQQLAVELDMFGDDYFNKRDEIIRTYKEQGRKEEIQGALKIKERFPQALLLFVTTKSAEVLKNRLTGRGTETEEVINDRMARAIEESEGIGAYEYIIVNDDLDTCVKETHSIIQSAKASAIRNEEFIKNIQQGLKDLSKGEK